ncbi:MAG TPA: AI-2E family transporter [Thermoanaerobaculia bacterium]|nr:AI-2E family transporter [Thermoanaerobaculia bacterium]
MATGSEKRREWRLAGIIVFAAVAVLVLAAALRILAPFLSPLMIGATLVILTYPLYRRLRDRLHGRAGLAAGLMLLGVTFLLILPAFLLTLLLVAQANALIERLQSPETRAMLGSFDFASHLRFLQRWFPNFDPATVSLERMVPPVLQQIPGWVARHGGALLGGLAGAVVGFFLVLLSSFYFYVEGTAMLAELEALSPLPRRYDRQFWARLVAVIEATFRGQVMTSLAQGIATTVGLLIAGVPGALLWGAVASVVALLPMVGGAAVWVPATIYLGIDASLGHRGWGWAIFLALWGVLVVSTIDNVVRPWAMKGQAELPAVPLLFAVLGGLQVFGFIGLVVGPLVFSLLKTVIDIYKESFAEAPESAA